MIHIMGRETVPEMQCLDDVREALDFGMDVYLGAFLAKPLGIALCDSVIYNMEYLHDNAPLVRSGYLETLRRNVVIDYSRENIRYLTQRGIDAFYLPYGYHAGLERMAPAEKTVDVLFVCTTHHPRRKALLERLAGRCNLVVATGAYGVELDRLVSRAKVHLNFHHAEGQPLEVVRINYLMANHCNVVSEPGSDYGLNAQYAPGLRFANYDGMINACLRALDEPKDGNETIKRMPQDCFAANEWARNKLCQP